MNDFLNYEVIFQFNIFVCKRGGFLITSSAYRISMNRAFNASKRLSTQISSKLKIPKIAEFEPDSISISIYSFITVSFLKYTQSEIATEFVFSKANNKYKLFS